LGDSVPNDAHLIVLFLEEQEQLGKKAATIHHRRLELNAFLDGVGSFDVTPRRIQNWLDSRDLEISTKRTYLWHYSEFYKWAIRHNYLDDNPAVRIIPPEERTLPQVLSFTSSDVERVLNTTSDVVNRGSRRGAVRCWIALAAFQGMPCREIADLTVEDIDLDRQIIHFRHESPSARSQILHPLVIAALQAMEPTPHGQLFPENDAQQISKALAKYPRECGINVPATGLVQWHAQQVEEFGKHFGRGPELNAKFDESGVDAALWQHIERYVIDGNWGDVALHAERFTEDRVRQWAKLPTDLFGGALMTKAFGDGGTFHLGMVDGERQGWHRLAMGISMALRNVDAHRIQDDRPDLKQYAVGVVGACSLLITQLRYQYSEQID
jgi:hypothetical protein